MVKKERKKEKKKIELKLNQKSILPSSFYSRDARAVAKDLLGKILVHKTEEDVTAGIIVETEAYLPQNDPASHAAKKKTEKNKPMFGKPGTAYVYFTYGNHYILNAVCDKEEVPAAVLIRALEPTAGIELMKKRRKTENLRNLTSGPGKLCQALRITKEQNETSLTKGNLIIIDNKYYPLSMVTTTRIGIEVGSDLPLRFYIKGNKFVSKL